MITWNHDDEMKVLIYNFPQQNDNKQSETNEKKVFTSNKSNIS